MSFTDLLTQIADYLNDHHLYDCLKPIHQCSLEYAPFKYLDRKEKTSRVLLQQNAMLLCFFNYCNYMVKLFPVIVYKRDLGVTALFIAPSKMQVSALSQYHFHTNFSASS